MASIATAIPSREEFEQAALDYLGTLTLEDLVESTDQHTQIIITESSLGLVTQRWPEFQCFGDLLIQYLHKGKMARVTPDNMIILSSAKIEKRLSLNLPHDDLRLMLIAEYVSEGRVNKDYVQSYAKYEKELCVRYYLTFHPPKQDLRLHVLDGDTYVRVEPNTDGRLAVPELDLEIAIHHGWARWWHKGKLLAIPAELAQQAEQHLERAIKAEKRAVQEKQRAEQEKQRADAFQAEVAELRAKLQKKAGASGNGSPPPGCP